MLNALRFQRDDHSSSVVIVHPGGLGDSVLALPALRSLRGGFPSHRLVWIGRSDFGQLLIACGEVHEAYALDGPLGSQLLTPGEHRPEALERMLHRCTHFIGWFEDRDGMVRERLGPYGIKSLVQSPQSPSLLAGHVSERFQEILKTWALEGPSGPVRLRLPFSFSAEWPVGWQTEGLASPSSPWELVEWGQLIVVHPGSGSREKCLKASFLAEFIRELLLKPERKLVLLQGPADEVHVENLVRYLEPSTYRVVRHPSLVETACWLQCASLYVGHDSGVSHLAGAMGTPSIVFFGPTDERRWGPRGSRVTIVRGGPCECQTWERVKVCQSKPCFASSVGPLSRMVEDQVRPGHRRRDAIRQALDRV